MPIVSTAASATAAAASLPANAPASSPGDDSLFAALLAGIGQTGSATADADADADADGDVEATGGGATSVIDPSILGAAPVTAVQPDTDLLSAEIPTAPTGNAAPPASTDQPASDGLASAILAALLSPSQGPTQAPAPSQPAQPAAAGADDSSGHASENAPAASAPADPASTASAAPPVVAQAEEDEDGTSAPPPQTASNPAPVAKGPAAKTDRNADKDNGKAQPQAGASAPDAQAAPALLAALNQNIVPPTPQKPSPPKSEDTVAALDKESSRAKIPAAASAGAPSPAQPDATPAAGPATPGDVKKPDSPAADNLAAKNAAADTSAPPPAAPPSSQSAQPPQPAQNFVSAVTAQQPSAANSNMNVTAGVSVHAAPQAPTAQPNLHSLAVDIAARSQNGARQFDIRLDPPELGRVEVRLSIDATGKAEAHMTADQPQTLHLLQKDAQTLTRALRDAGLDVSNNSLNFSLKGQQRQGDGGQNQPRPAPAQMLTATRTLDAAQTGAAIRWKAADARLDIHV
jgi:flagellar hook-length control protein FliK